MAYLFGDGFDLYATANDLVIGYWDTGTIGNLSFVAGRLGTSQALQWANATNLLTKSSGANDALHHFNLAIRQTAAISGTTLGHYFTLYDGTSAQCSVVFRSDGAILLTSGGAGAAAIATYAGAVGLTNTWYSFEIEVFVSNTGGYMNVRKNGNPANDFASATNLNTRAGSTNPYANKLTIGLQSAVAYHQIDDLLWRSDAAGSVPWIGDPRCYARMPASDVSTQFARVPTGPIVQTTANTNATAYYTGQTAWYSGMVAAYSGTVTSVGIGITAVGSAVNMKCAIHADNGSGGPGAVLASATAIVTPVISGTHTFTFSPGVAIVKGVTYWIASIHDGSAGTTRPATPSNNVLGMWTPMSYAVFPQANPAVSIVNLASATWSFSTTAANYQGVNEIPQDGVASYVYDATPGHADLYTHDQVTTPTVTHVALITRGLIGKGDAGTRTGAMQLKSGATTVATTTVNLPTGFVWSWRTDTLNPATGTAWTVATANAVQTGPVVIS